jgi:hypothetical protein
MAVLPREVSNDHFHSSSILDTFSSCKFNQQKPVSPAAIAPSGSVAFAAVIQASTWTKEEVTVGFLQNDPPYALGLTALIQQLAPTWLENTGLWFRFLPAGWQMADVRVSFDPNGGFWSWMGSQSASGSRNVASLNLGFSAQSFANVEDRQRLILHEFGHALGLAHEHQNAGDMIDVNKAVEYYRNNGLGNLTEEQLRAQFEQIPKADLDPRSSSFDPKSVMLYPFPAGIFKDGPTSYNYELSKLDRETVRKIYPKANNFRHGRPGMELNLFDKTKTDAFKTAYYLFGTDSAQFYFKIEKPGEYWVRMAAEPGDKVYEPLNKAQESPADPLENDRFLSGTTFQIFDETLDWEPGKLIPGGEFKFDLFADTPEASKKSTRVNIAKPGFYYIKAQSTSQDSRALFRFVPSVEAV